MRGRDGVYVVIKLIIMTMDDPEKRLEEDTWHRVSDTWPFTNCWPRDFYFGTKSHKRSKVPHIYIYRYYRSKFNSRIPMTLRLNPSVHIFVVGIGHIQPKSCCDSTDQTILLGSDIDTRIVLITMGMVRNFHNYFIMY